MKTHGIKECEALDRLCIVSTEAVGSFPQLCRKSALGGHTTYCRAKVRRKIQFRAVLWWAVNNCVAINFIAWIKENVAILD